MRNMLKTTFSLFIIIQMLLIIACKKQPKIVDGPVKKEIELNKITLPLNFPVSEARVVAIAGMLSAAPKGFGDTIGNRTTWATLLASGRFKAIIAKADEAITTPFPEISDALYLSFYNSTDSESSKTRMNERSSLLAAMVWAECLQNTGKYLPSIENAVNELIKQKSWNFPGDDRAKTNFNGTRYTIGLCAADYGHTLAQTLYLLSEKLTPSLKTKIKDALYLRIFKPVISSVETGDQYNEMEALTKTNNYNAVCLSGVVGAALTAIADKKERAIFAAIGEHYSKNTIAGFLDDGYCNEGLSYYNYGFSHYVLLRESLLQATAKGIDLFNDPKVKNIALFPSNLLLMNDIYPAIGDCAPDALPSGYMMYYVSRNLRMGLSAYDKYAAGPNYGTLSNLMYNFPNSANSASSAVSSTTSQSIRSYFYSAGVLTVRPAAGSALNMAATLKGGNNNESHNHNDLGSFSIVVGNEMLMGDPGLAIYTSKTFSAERYTAFKTMTSYAHPVPMIAGIQQKEGPSSVANIIITEFRENQDRMIMDIGAAYPIPGAKKILRTFTYKRSSDGFLEVKDEVEHNSAQTFETALITRANWKLINTNTIEITGMKEKLLVTINAPGSGFTVSAEVINEALTPYTRLGIKLKNPLLKGAVTMTFKPVK